MAPEKADFLMHLEREVPVCYHLRQELIFTGCNRHLSENGFWKDMERFG